MKQLAVNQERLSTLQTDAIMAEHLHRYALALELTKGKDVLDLASGEGYGSYLLSTKANKTFGVDISSQAISHAKQKYIAKNLEFLVGNAFEIPLLDNSIDLIVSFETIEHHDQHERMMEECKRVLKQDGLMIISSPDKLNYSDIPNYKNPYHIKELYLSEFKILLKKYFKNIALLNQVYFNGSVIESLNCQNSEIMIFDGTYDKLNSTKNITPLYNIAILSDRKIEEIPTSIFKHTIPPDTRAEELEKRYLNSTTWKVGKFILFPLSKTKEFLKRVIERK
jgi:ubiquinone/menaquinone biosynthesis C-methylase UbiE